MNTYTWMLVTMLAILLISIVVVLLVVKKRKNRLSEDEEEGEEEEEAVTEDGVTFTTVDNLFEDAGLVRFHEGMIEYENDVFSMIAEMGQSNPALKSAEETKIEDMIFETWCHTIKTATIHNQSRNVDITEHLRKLEDEVETAENVTDQMRMFGNEIIKETKLFQKSADRFENRTFLIMKVKIDREGVDGESDYEIDEMIKEKAYETLLRRMRQSHSLLRRAGHPLAILSLEGILELMYITLNRKKSSKVRFYDMVRSQTFAPYVSAVSDDRMLKIVQEKIAREYEIEKELRKAADDSWKKSAPIVVNAYKKNIGEKSSITSNRKNISIEFD